MVDIAKAARNMLVQAPRVKDLVARGVIGSDTVFKEGWIFPFAPSVNIDTESHQALVVLTRGGEWAVPNEQNTALFPRLILDVWAAPTRLAGGTFKRDADELIDEVIRAMSHYLHTPNHAVPSMEFDPTDAFQGVPGMPRYWGTAEQIKDHTGLPVFSSIALQRSPEYFDVENGQGARMGRFEFGVETA
jgi:hypothetical protein